MAQPRGKGTEAQSILLRCAESPEIRSLEKIKRLRDQNVSMVSDTFTFISMCFVY
jgi:hypothetical protein